MGISSVSDQPKQRSLPPRLSLIRVATRFWYLYLLLITIALAFSYWWTFYAFTDRGYQPPQPVPYSHRLHAGQKGLDCQFCHFNAERGKHAGVPPASICLGCHGDDKGQVAIDSEYIKTLTMMSDLEDPAAAYADGDDLDGRDEGTMKEGGVPHWNRVHLLPDHVYFRHEAHVKAGVSCQTCHGPVQDMEVVYQYAPLTMGWCMDCHRNDNYVGGTEYNPEDQSTFSVGSANRTVKKLRVRPDSVVPFEDRYTKAKSKGAEEGGAHGGGTTVVPEPSHHLRYGYDSDEDDKLGGRKFFTQAMANELSAFFEKYPDLPRWKVPNLPEVHAELYYTEEQKAAGHANIKDLRSFDTFQNAPTDCSTCHQ